jgi:nitric oxide reductase subunit B
MSDFVDENGTLIFSAADIVKGQLAFFRYGLMDYGSFLGDGGMRGPDFTAEALHLTARWMHEYYDRQWQGKMPEDELRIPVVHSLVQQELKKNLYDAEYYAQRGEPQATRYDAGAVTLSAAQVYAYQQLLQFYAQKFGAGGELAGIERFKPAGYITDPEAIRHLSAFFYWGGWLFAVERPSFPYSYTHNWPYDPLAGNVPHGGLVF